tara:strand:+ start:194 stop:463 length:270 start_codon:yes stop_codon:yes gene_type:complete
MSQIKIEKNIPEPMSSRGRSLLSLDDLLTIREMQVGDSFLAPKSWVYETPNRKGLIQLKPAVRSAFVRLGYECRAGTTTEGDIRVWRTK